MKRLLKVIISLLLLSGCQEYDGNIQYTLNQSINEGLNSKLYSPNSNHKYYSYYLEPCIGKIKSTLTGNIFMFDGVKFVMNLNVSTVLENNYDSDSLSVQALKNSNLVASSTGTYTDYLDQIHDYSFMVYETDGNYYSLLTAGAMECFSISNELESVKIAEVMLKLIRTVNVDDEAITADFSDKEKIESNREKLQLFQNIAPENGAIEELFEDYVPDNSDDYQGDNYEVDDDKENVNDGTYAGDDFEIPGHD